MGILAFISLLLILLGSAGLIYSGTKDRVNVGLVAWVVMLAGLVLILPVSFATYEEPAYQTLGKEIRDCHAQMDLGKAGTYAECGIDLEHPDIEKAMYWCKKYRECRRMGTEDPQPCLFYNR